MYKQWQRWIVFSLFLPGNVNKGLVFCSAELWVTSLLRRSPKEVNGDGAVEGSLLASTFVLEIPVK